MAIDKDAGYREPLEDSLEDVIARRSAQRSAFIEKEEGGVVERSIRSSAISHARYDPATEDLTLTFHKGLRRVYTLEGVSKDLFDRFLASSSKGLFFQEHLRGRY